MTPKQVVEAVEYNSETGEFFSKKTGKKLNFLRNTSRDNDVCIKVGDSFFKAKRVAYLIMLGRWPNFSLEFNDGNERNLKWDNINEVEISTRKKVTELTTYRLRRDIVEMVEFTLRKNPYKELYIQTLREIMSTDNEVKRLTNMNIGDVIDELKEESPIFKSYNK